jgi:hypothetical protein
VALGSSEAVETTLGALHEADGFGQVGGVGVDAHPGHELVDGGEIHGARHSSAPRLP